MINPGTLGAAVRFHREAAGLTRSSLSELTGVGTNAIYQVEHGKETIKLRTLLRLLEALNLELRIDGPLMDRFWASYAEPNQPDAHS